MIDVDTHITYVCLHSLDRIGEGRVGKMQQIVNALFWPYPLGPVFSNAALLVIQSTTTSDWSVSFCTLCLQSQLVC